MLCTCSRLTMTLCLSYAPLLHNSRTHSTTTPSLIRGGATLMGIVRLVTQHKMCLPGVQEAATALGHPSPFDATGNMIPELAALEEQFGAPRGESTQWGSCLRIVDPSSGSLQTASVLHLNNNEAALCMCLVRFSTHDAGHAMLAVGTAKGLSFYPRQAESAWPSCLLLYIHRSKPIRVMKGLARFALEGWPRWMFDVFERRVDCVLGRLPGGGASGLAPLNF
jgi:hypothetical protein